MQNTLNCLKATRRNIEETSAKLARLKAREKELAKEAKAEAVEARRIADELESANADS